MADTMEKAQQRWDRETARAASYQQREDYRRACQAAHAWAVATMGGK